MKKYEPRTKESLDAKKGWHICECGHHNWRHATGTWGQDIYCEECMCEKFKKEHK